MSKRTLGEILAALFAALLWPLQILHHLCVPASPENPYDAATHEIRQAEERILSHEPTAEDVRAKIAREYMSGRDVDLSIFRKNQQVWLVSARASGVDVGAMPDDMLMDYVSGRWAARGYAPLVDPSKFDRAVRAIEYDDVDMEPEARAPGY